MVFYSRLFLSLVLWMSFFMLGVAALPCLSGQLSTEGNPPFPVVPLTAPLAVGPFGPAVGGRGV